MAELLREDSTKVPQPLHLSYDLRSSGKAALRDVVVVAVAAVAVHVEAYEAAADGDACCLTLTTSNGVTASAVMTMEPTEAELSNACRLRYK